MSYDGWKGASPYDDPLYVAAQRQADKLRDIEWALEPKLTAIEREINGEQDVSYPCNELRLDVEVVTDDSGTVSIEANFPDVDVHNLPAALGDALMSLGRRIKQVRF